MELIVSRGLDDRALRAAILAAIRQRVRFEAYVWLLTDPETTVGSSPLADVPVLADLSMVVRLKYTSPTNRWTSLLDDEVATMASDRNRSKTTMLPELSRRYGVTDVLNVVFRDRFGCWGFLDLWRTSDMFTSDECVAIGELLPIVTAGLRHSLLPTFDQEAAPIRFSEGPAVLLLSNDLQLKAHTPQTDAYLRALLPTAVDRNPIPAAAYNVGGQLLSLESGVDTHPPTTRLPLVAGHWVSLRAARIADTESTATPAIAVTIEATPSNERADMYARVAGLTARQADVLHSLSDGSGSRAVAHHLGITQHTVQDHLKAIFAKTNTSSRSTLVARATGSGRPR